MKRYISVWFPYWPTDLWRRRNKQAGPLALFASGAGGTVLSAVDEAAAAEGVYPGQGLVDARALVPHLQAERAEPARDYDALGRLVEWCSRYTPWSALDGADGVILDITGCAHLFDGEAALIDDLRQRLQRLGITARAAVADTPGAAWAWARFGDSAILAVGATRAKLAGLPVEALRLAPDTIDALQRLGLHRIADIVKLPRGPLTTRLGMGVLQRLDRAFGVDDEPISPHRPTPSWQVRMEFPEEISRREDIDQVTRHLLDELCDSLAAEGRGIRRVELAFYRVDGSAQFLVIGTSAASRDAAHLARLFAEKLGTVAPGFGIETMILGALATDLLAPVQIALASGKASHPQAIAEFVDRLETRLGAGAVMRLVPAESHIPERAVSAGSAVTPLPHHAWPQRARPLRLLTPPETITVNGAPHAPQWFHWRHKARRILQVEGPERIAPEWWRDLAGSAATRDYFRIEDGEGCRYWIYRTRDREPAWYLHGLFA